MLLILEKGLLYNIVSVIILGTIVATPVFLIEIIRTFLILNFESQNIAYYIVLIYHRYLF